MLIAGINSFHQVAALLIQSTRRIAKKLSDDDHGKQHDRDMNPIPVSTCVCGCTKYGILLLR